MAEGFRYVWRRPELVAAILMMLLIGTFGLNFPIFISTMAVSVFHLGASEFGFLTSIMALGSVAGALFAASRARPTFGLLLGAAVIFGMAAALAAAMPSYALFGAVLVIVRRCRADLHDLNQCARADVERARRARPRRRHTARGGHGRAAAGRAGRRLGGRPVWSALGACRRRDVRVCGSGRRPALPRAPQEVNRNAVTVQSITLDIVSIDIISCARLPGTPRAMDKIANFGYLLKDLGRLYTRRFEERAQALQLTLPQCKALGYPRPQRGHQPDAPRGACRA